MKKLFFTFLILTSSTVFAGPSITGAKLYEMGQAAERLEQKSAAGDDLANMMMMSAYLWGVHDLASGISFCLGGTNPAGPQGRAIVMKYLQENPERWNESGALLAAEAFNRAFPCKK